MKILFLSFYYYPDLCACSFRATPLIAELRNLLPAHSAIDVVTTLPNRYQTFSSEAPESETYHDLTITRIAIPGHASGMLDQSKSYLTFARTAVKLASRKEYDLVVATSSRLMTAALGSYLARKQGAKLYLDIRDIFVDTIKDVLPKRFALLAKPFFSLLERWTVARADKVNLVSAGFGDYFRTRYPGKNLSFFTNGIDDDFLNRQPAGTQQLTDPGSRPLTAVYAGNIGEGQGLHAILPELAGRLGDRIHFRIIGDGGRKEALAASLRERGVTSVELLPPVKRDELLAEYQRSDLLFLHLNDYEAFKKVLPSKIFEYAALGKPIWAGVSGYAADFITSEVSNAAVFRPCDAGGALTALDRLVIRDAPRRDFIEKYQRSAISRQLAADIMTVGHH